MMLRGGGVGLGMSYEFMAGDYTDVNFAGGKLSGQNFKRRCGVMHATYLRGIEAPVDRRFTDVAMSMNMIPRVRAGANPYAVRFTHPSWEFDVNPLQSVKAAAARMAAGISSLRREIAERGDDPDEIWREIAEESEIGKKLKLNLHAVLTAQDDTIPAPAA